MHLSMNGDRARSSVEAKPAAPRSKTAAAARGFGVEMEKAQAKRCPTLSQNVPNSTTRRGAGVKMGDSPHMQAEACTSNASNCDEMPRNPQWPKNAKRTQI